MRREAMGYIAAFAAAVSLGALGYAVVWGVDPADLGRRPVAPDVRSVPPPIAPKIVPAPPLGEDATRAGSGSAFGHVMSVDNAARSAAPASPPVPLSLLHPVEQPMPIVPGLDAPPIASLSPRLAEPSAAIESSLPEPAAPASALVPQAAMLEPPIDAPAALPDPEPVGTIAPPEPPASRIVQPGRELLRVKPIVRPTLRRALRPRGPRTEPEPLEPKGITVVRGAPPVPTPGPLIIHVPDSMQR